jgi:hypothetical protein
MSGVSITEQMFYSTPAGAGWTIPDALRSRQCPTSRPLPGRVGRIALAVLSETNRQPLPGRAGAIHLPESVRPARCMPGAR